MESTSEPLFTDSLTGKLVYIIHSIGEGTANSVGIYNEADNLYLKLTPPTIEKLESLDKATFNWIIQNPHILQFADAIILREKILVFKDLETTNEVLKEYVQATARKHSEN